MNGWMDEFMSINDQTYESNQSLVAQHSLIDAALQVLHVSINSARLAG